MRTLFYFLLGLLLGMWLAVAITTFAATEPIKCAYVVLMTDGDAEAYPYGHCGKYLLRITATAIEIKNEGQIIVLPLPSGWGVGLHTITYIVGEGTFTFDNTETAIHVKGW